MKNTTPRELVNTMAINPRLVDGDDERFTGYGAMGVPYADGHYLALRDMLATSIGPAYRTLWHRTPAGRWTIFTNTAPDLSCPRYFGAATATEQVPAIDTAWLDDWTLQVSMGDRFSWRIVLGASPATRMMTSMAQAMPDTAWDSDAVLGAMGPMAGGFLGIGRTRLRGVTPNGQSFKAAPLQVWRVVGGQAWLDGVQLGELGPLPEQDALGDFWLPQRGLFFAGRARFSAGTTNRRSEQSTAGSRSGSR
jgi:hypothetical protein